MSTIKSVLIAAVIVLAIIILADWANACGSGGEGCPSAVEGVSQDGAGDWRINTYPEGAGELQPLTFGLVYTPGKGTIYENYYGFADTTGCTDGLATKKENRKHQAYFMLERILGVLATDDYIVSMSIAVCHSEWYVIYISYKDGTRADKELYERVMAVL
jgi:hypothetical protein